MSDMKCNQAGCEKQATYRFTWPGNDEAGICEQHSAKLRGIAQSMGLYIQLIPLSAAKGEGK